MGRDPKHARIRLIALLLLAGAAGAVPAVAGTPTWGVGYDSGTMTLLPPPTPCGMIIPEGYHGLTVRRRVARDWEIVLSGRRYGRESAGTETLRDDDRIVLASDGQGHAGWVRLVVARRLIGRGDLDCLLDVGVIRKWDRWRDTEDLRRQDAVHTASYSSETDTWVALIGLRPTVRLVGGLWIEMGHWIAWQDRRGETEWIEHDAATGALVSGSRQRGVQTGWLRSEGWSTSRVSLVLWF